MRRRRRKRRRVEGKGGGGGGEGGGGGGLNRNYKVVSVLASTNVVGCPTTGENIQAQLFKGLGRIQWGVGVLPLDLNVMDVLHQLGTQHFGQQRGIRSLGLFI